MAECLRRNIEKPGVLNYDDFRAFLTRMIARGRVPQKYIDAFLSEKGMANFRKAFVHASWNADPSENYEGYEFFGDSVISQFVAFYIAYRWPHIKTSKWMSKIDHNLVGRKWIGRLAQNEGLSGFVLFGNSGAAKGKGPNFDMITALQANRDAATNDPYLAMMEDVMEAFFGCLMLTILATKNPTTGVLFSHGAATQVCHNILRTFFDPVEISVAFEDVFDAVSRLKELYEAKELNPGQKPLRWSGPNAGGVFRYTELPDGKTECIVYGWPEGDRSVIPQNRRELGRAVEINKDDAKQKASKQALAVLKDRYGIVEKIPRYQ